MNQNMRIPTRSTSLALLLVLSSSALWPAEQRGHRILRQTRLHGGLVVHVGCKDATLTRALGANPRCVVQGLERDPLKVDRARSTLRAGGNYGRISIFHWSGGQLPYADNLVNLLVVDDPDCHLQGDEIVRVPMRVRAMVLAGDTLFIAGPPDVVADEDPAGAFEGRRGADLWALSAATGETLREIQHLKVPPVYDGLIAAEGSLYLSAKDGRVHCFAAP
jgi:hypothetical protein